MYTAYNLGASDHTNLAVLALDAQTIGDVVVGHQVRPAGWVWSLWLA